MNDAVRDYTIEENSRIPPKKKYSSERVPKTTEAMIAITDAAETANRHCFRSLSVAYRLHVFDEAANDDELGNETREDSRAFDITPRLVRQGHIGCTRFVFQFT